MVILEAYYSDLYADRVCQDALDQAGQLRGLTKRQLVRLLGQFESGQPAASGAPTSTHNSSQLVRLSPTLDYYAANNKRPLCIQDLKLAFQAKCSGRPSCRFSAQTDHQLPACVKLKPGHLFVRYLCADDSLLVKYCNADARLASRSSAASRVRRQAPDTAEPTETPIGPADTLDFGFIASPGYPDFYATPEGARCGWTVEAELNQRITVKLLDASLAPHTAARLLQPAQQQSAQEPPSSPELLLELLSRARADGQVRVGGLGAHELLVESSLTTSQPSTDTPADQRANVFFEKLQFTAKHASANNSLASLLGSQNNKIVFKIDEHDYELLRAAIASTLEQVATQCRGYDHLVLRDSAAQLDEGPFQLIPKLPITLYRNRLIDFANNTIYHESDNKQARRLDYQALLANLNPLQLIWLYQHNVTLCSNGHQDDLSSPRDKDKVSFTSLSHKIHLDLISGHKFNPTNRGVLFWFHKHGCPASLRPPKRARLIYRNETTEVFECFQGFVFNDTRQTMRIKRCSPEDQQWHDQYLDGQEAPLEQPEGGEQQSDGCVYVEELANSQLQSSPAKFDRLVLTDPVETQQQQQASASSQAAPTHRVTSSGAQDVAVEVVGVSQPAPTLPPIEHPSAEEIEFLEPSAKGSAGSTGVARLPAGNSTSGPLVNLWYQMMELVNSQPTRSITTNERLRDQAPLESQASFWHRAGALFDRRLIAPAVIVLFLFILINLIIYVIFLVALPKFGRLLCRSANRLLFANDLSKCDSQTPNLLGSGPSTLAARRNNCQYQSSPVKIGHYESEYSVTMGLSL